MKENSSLQKNLFAAIKTKLPAHLSLPQEVADALKISSDGAYRRIRGEIALSLEELKILAGHFHFSIDQHLLLEQNTLLFYGKAIGQEDANFMRHMQSIGVYLESIAASEEKEIFCSAKDIPIFHYFNLPEITAFKFYFWMKNVIATPSLKDKKFNKNFARESGFPVGQNMLELYNRCPSTEIWSYETVNNVLRQIDFCFQSGWFESKDDVKLLHDQIILLIHHIEHQVEGGKKFTMGKEKTDASASYQMYLNEVVIGDNSYLAVLDNRKLAFINHAVVNYIMTTDDHFCEITQWYFTNLMKKSLPISSVSEKERSRFFHYLRDLVTKQRDKLEAIGS